jgi:serine phosphatase RsbU (regulator of sigma subunit)
MAEKNTNSPDEINLDPGSVYLELERKNEEVEFQRKELELANAQINEAMNALWGEMELAKKIQTVLLPKNPKIPGYELSVHMLPTAEIGGDYYDIINNEDCHWIVIGDVSGHGISAGLVMMMAQTSIQTVLGEKSHLSPLELLSIVNKCLSANLQKMGESKYLTMTVLCCQNHGNFHFSGLHQDILIYRKNDFRVESIETDGMWLGLEQDITDMLQVDSFSMEIGDVALLFTDGLIEVTDNQGELYGIEKLKDILKDNGSKSTESIKSAIIEAIRPYIKNDDITFLILKRKK